MQRVVKLGRNTDGMPFGGFLDWDLEGFGSRIHGMTDTQVQSATGCAQQGHPLRTTPSRERHGSPVLCRSMNLCRGQRADATFAVKDATIAHAFADPLEL